MSDANEVISQTASGQLKSIIERVERLETEKSEIAEQIKEVLSEAKGNGFSVPIIRKVIKRRKMDRAKVFTTIVSVKGVAKGVGAGLSKQDASQAAAAMALARAGEKAPEYMPEPELESRHGFGPWRRA